MLCAAPHLNRDGDVSTRPRADSSIPGTPSPSQSLKETGHIQIHTSLTPQKPAQTRQQRRHLLSAAITPPPNHQDLPSSSSSGRIHTTTTPALSLSSRVDAHRFRMQLNSLDGCRSALRSKAGAGGCSIISSRLPLLPARQTQPGSSSRRTSVVPRAVLDPDQLAQHVQTLAHHLPLLYEPVAAPCSLMNCGDVVHRR